MRWGGKTRDHWEGRPEIVGREVEGREESDGKAVLLLLHDLPLAPWSLVIPSTELVS
jgi:hypothetical protein